MEMTKFSYVFFTSAALAFACNVESKGDSDSGGLGGALNGLGGNTAFDGNGGAGGEDALECPRGVAVVLSNWAATQIALSDLSGKTLVKEFLSSDSTTTDGLAYPLSGDVALPRHPAAGNELVVVDRYGTNVLSWVALRSGKVRAQLPVGTGFESNPQDYAALSDSLAVVSRWGENASAGEEAFDSGSDILFIDTNTPKILKSVAMPHEDDLPPRPGSLSFVDGDLFVTLERVALDWSSAGDAMLVPVDIDTRTAGEPLTLTGLKNCGALTPTPDGKELALVCTGALDQEGDVAALSQSAVVFFDRAKRPLVETRRVTAEDIAGEPLQNQIEFITNSLALVKTQTVWGGDKNNRLVAYDFSKEKATTLVEAEPDGQGAGQGLTLGSIVCYPGCSDRCLVPNASTAKLEVIDISGGGTKVLSPVTVEDSVGMPPRSLGEY